jgi:anti-sigma factor (TIGR02949 family)
MGHLSNWVKKNVLSKYVMTNCPEKQKCLEILDLILDEEADHDQEEYFKNHMEECWSCFQNYELEKAIRDLVKAKLERKPIPGTLIDDIKAKISESQLE